MGAGDWFKEGFLAGLLGRSYWSYKSWQELRSMNSGLQQPPLDAMDEEYARRGRLWMHALQSFERILYEFRPAYSGTDQESLQVAAQNVLPKLEALSFELSLFEITPLDPIWRIGPAVRDMHRASEEYAAGMRCYLAGDFLSGGEAVQRGTVKYNIAADLVERRAREVAH